MSQEVLERESPGETQPHPNYRVILINDNQTTVDHIETSLSKYIPGMSSQKAHQLALKVKTDGFAVVWVGPKELAEMYYELLKSEGFQVSLEPDG